MSLFSSATPSGASGDLGPARITSSRRQTSDVSWSKPATDAPNLRMASDATRRPQPRLKWTREGLALVSPRRAPRRLCRPMPTRRPGSASSAARSASVGRVRALKSPCCRAARAARADHLAARGDHEAPQHRRAAAAAAAAAASRGARAAAAAAVVEVAARQGAAARRRRRRGRRRGAEWLGGHRRWCRGRLRAHRGRAPAVGSGGLGPPSPSPRPSPAAPASPRPAAGDPACAARS